MKLYYFNKNKKKIIKFKLFEELLKNGNMGFKVFLILEL